jgi:phosphoribosylamine--glycine ligase
MKILIVGSGGREHALAWKLAASPRVKALYAAPGSAAIERWARCVDLKTHAEIVAFAERERVDLTVIGPEAPLVEGLADDLAGRGQRVFGPSRAAARLEGSKGFAKAFMERHGIPTAAYAAFDNLAAALRHVESLAGPFVVKADGLAAGKGVIICEDREAGRTALRRMMAERAFGEAGGRVVIESFLLGEEASYFALSDGQDFISLPSVQDHKAVGDLDRGPNTGGMGAYCPAPVVTPEVERRILEEIVRPTLRGMAAEGHPYRGVLYVGLMIDQGRPAVVEYNCRFGDPECQVQMLLLEDDLLDLLEAACAGSIGQARPRWRAGAAACIVMASGGYPGVYAKGLDIEGLEQVPESERCQVFHSGTARQNGRWSTQGGRVLGVTAWGEDLRAALGRGYRAVERIHWPGAHYRRDIGLKGLRHAAAQRPALNVGVIGEGAQQAETCAAIVERLERLEVRARHAAPALGAEFRPWLREQEEAGAEVFIAVGASVDFARRVAGQTGQAVIGCGAGAPAESAQPAGGAAAVCWTAGVPDAVALAAQMLALKYPDLHAARVRHRLLQTAALPEATRPGSSTPS